MENRAIDVAPSTRRGFLRSLAAFGAVGLGAAAFAGTAHAEPTRCCQNNSICGGCGAGTINAWCIGGCGGCCVCLNPNQGTCQSFNCPCP
jgi:hypothetical protein